MLSSNRIFSITNVKYLVFNISLQRKIKKMNFKTNHVSNVNNFSAEWGTFFRYNFWLSVAGANMDKKTQQSKTGQGFSHGVWKQLLF